LILNGIPKEDLLIITGQLPPEQETWEKFVADFFKRLKVLEKVLRGKEIIHLAINGPSALAFAFGAVMGSQKSFAIYHKQDSKYYPIEVYEVRALKERVKNYKQVSWRLEKGGKDLVVIISFAHHEPEANAKEFMKGKNPTYLILEHRKKGNIPVKDMLDTAKECASLIQDIRAKESFKDIHIFLSSPVPVAFMIGVAFGYYSSGYLYQHKGGGDYFRAVDLSRVKEIREGGKHAVSGEAG
jgi:hypothetical protein